VSVETQRLSGALKVQNYSVRQWYKALPVNLDNIGGDSLSLLTPEQGYYRQALNTAVNHVLQRLPFKVKLVCAIIENGAEEMVRAGFEAWQVVCEGHNLNKAKQVLAFFVLSWSILLLKAPEDFFNQADDIIREAVQRLDYLDAGAEISDKAMLRNLIEKEVPGVGLLPMGHRSIESRYAAVENDVRSHCSGVARTRKRKGDGNVSQTSFVIGRAEPESVQFESSHVGGGCPVDSISTSPSLGYCRNLSMYTTPSSSPASSQMTRASTQINTPASDCSNPEESYDRCPDAICGKEFTGGRDARKANYKRHMNDIHGPEKRFDCPCCTSFYNRDDNLLAHIRRIHPEWEVPPLKRRRGLKGKLASDE